MPNLLAMSFEGEWAPSFDLLCLGHGHRLPDGWGIGYYPGGEPSASVLKEPAPPPGSIRGELVKAWEHLASSLFILHLRHATWGSISDANTQPFSRSYARRDWLFAHAGSVTRRLDLRPQRFEPVGSTDTEVLFCELLSRFAEREWRSIGDANPEILRAWLEELDAYGGLTVALCDGRDLAIYPDRAGDRPLYLWELRPPYGRVAFGDDDLAVDLTRRGLKSRKGVIVTSDPLRALDEQTPEPLWQAIAPGDLVIVRQGAIRRYVPRPPPPMPLLREAPPLPGGLGAVRAVGEVWETVGGTAPAPAESGNIPLSSDVPPPNANAAVPVAPPAETGEAPPSAPLPIGTLAVAPRVRRGFVRPASAPERTLSVLHRTSYHYDRPVERSVQMLRLAPMDDSLQRLLAFHLHLSVDGRHADYDDVFGNRARKVWLETPYNELIIESRSRVRLLDRDPLAHGPTHTRTTIPLAWMPWQRHMLQPYLLPPELPESELRELFDYAMSFVERNDYDLLDTLLDLNTTIYEEYRYLPGSTHLMTTAFDVYVNRRGVCQDFTNLFICLARLLGVPARYVCGYLYTGPKATPEARAMAEATHAWVQVYLPEVGWKGFDPTNGVLTQTDHVRVAVGRSFIDATPTAGTIFLGGGHERLNVVVRVEAEEEADPTAPLPDVPEE